jgi:hypothetical protein
VTITPTGDDDCAVSGALLFTTSTWNAPQLVTVTAVDDMITECAHTCTIANAATSSNGSYTGISVASVTGNVTEDNGFPSELLDNGSFELHTINDKRPDNWTVKSTTGDKLLCKPGKAHTGLCAFRLRGGAGEKVQLIQMVDLSGVPFTSGDTLILSAFIFGKSPAAKTKLVLSVTYLDGSASQTQVLIVKKKTTYTLVTLPLVLTSGAVAQITVTLKHRSLSGMVWVDHVSLIHTPVGSRRSDAFPLPFASGGFRGSN